MTSERTAWDRHWHTTSHSGTMFGRIASLVRKTVLSRAVRGYAELFFPGSGILVECGCGTGQASSLIPRRGRTLVALDFSADALRDARRITTFSAFLQGDIRALPFADESLSGIWNLGVLEHFDQAAGVSILREFGRVLRPGAAAILFWPPELGSSRWVLGPLEWWKSKRSGRPFRFFPDEVNRLRSKRHAREILAEAGLEPVAVDFTPRDGFIHMVLVAQKPAR